MRLAAGLMTADSGPAERPGYRRCRQPPTGPVPHWLYASEIRVVRGSERPGKSRSLRRLCTGSESTNGERAIGRLMEMTALGPFLQRLAGRLSGGMKQKLGLACTLIRSPELLLLDEPTVGVDPLSRRELWAIILQLVNEQGLTVLVSTSYLDEAERCATCRGLARRTRYWPRVVRTK